MLVGTGSSERFYVYTGHSYISSLHDNCINNSELRHIFISLPTQLCVCNALGTKTMPCPNLVSYGQAKTKYFPANMSKMQRSHSLTSASEVML